MEHFYQNTEGENWFDYSDFYKYIPNHFGQNAIFVEVGVWKGKSISFLAVEVINQNKNQKIYAVDTWSYENYLKIGENADHKQSNILYETYLKNIEPVKNWITNIKQTSVEAAKQFDNRSIDFVFIDADHDYESVKNDILVWLPKLKNTGILAGHDYANNSGVKIAVDELFDANDITFPTKRTWMYKLTR